MTDKPHAVTYVCSTCGFDLWLPLAALSVSTLGFYNDSRFPGRCILVLNEHYDELADLPDDLTVSFARDTKRAGHAVGVATNASRVNYAVLGNTVPHVHCHIMPRFVEPLDPNPTRPIWESPLPRGTLSDDNVSRISNEILAVLNTPSTDQLGSLS